VTRRPPSAAGSLPGKPTRIKAALAALNFDRRGRSPGVEVVDTAIEKALIFEP
jgi:hypothetical protein